MFHLEDDPLDQAIKTSQRAFWYLAFFGFVVSFLTLATSIYSLEVFDRVLSGGSFATLGVLTLIMVIFLALLNFVQAIRMAILSDIADFLDEKLSSFLINISFKTNIAKMQKKFDDEKVIEAAKIAFAHQMILKLPKGYETDIGMWGTKLSAGQRQRIALARAFYGDPKLVILDEPNSNLDTEGEAALAHCLVEAKKRKITTIIISHRQQIIENVDKILVLVAGEAKAFGDKEEVIKKMTNNGQLN